MRYFNNWYFFADFVSGAIGHVLFALSGWYFVGFIMAGWRLFDVM